MHRRRPAAVAAAAAVAVAFVAPAYAAATTATWTTPSSGSWYSAPMFWSTNPVAPNNGTPDAATTYDVVIGATGPSPYTVTLNQNAAIVDSVTLQSPNATLSVNGLPLTALNGVKVNAGTLLLNGGTLLNTVIDGPKDAVQVSSGGLDNVTFANGATINQAFIQHGLTLGKAGAPPALVTVIKPEFNGAQTINGSGTIQMIYTGPSFYTPLVARNGPLTIGSGITIEGAGSIVQLDGKMLNKGTIRSTDTKTALIIERPNNLVTEGFLNQGVVEAAPGTTLRIEAPFDGTGGTVRANGGTVFISGNSFYNLSQTTSKFGTLEATNGGHIALGGLIANTGTTLTATPTTGDIQLFATVTGGRLATTGGARFVANNSFDLTNVTVAGRIDVATPSTNTAATLNAKNLTLDGGVISLAGLNFGFGANASIRADAGTIGGSGVIQFDGSFDKSEIRGNGSTGTLTLGPDVQVKTGTGGGSITGGGLIDNQGAISAETAGQKITLNQVRNSGRIYVRNGGTVEGTGLDNRSSITVDGQSSTLRLLSGWDNPAGGSITATFNGTIAMAAPPTTSFGSVRATDSTINLSAGQFKGLSELSLVHSTIDLPSQAVLDAGGKTITIGNFSTVRLSGGTLRGATVAGAGINPGTVQVPTAQFGSLDGVTLGVPADVQGGGTLSIANALTLQGNAVVSLNSGTTTATAAKMQVASPATIAGPGSIVFNGTTIPGAITAAGPLEIGTGTTVQTGTGSGSISVPNILTNKGTIASQTFNQTLTISATSVVNQGRILVTSNNTLVVPAVQNTGTIDVFGTGALTLAGNWSNTGSGVINLARGTNLTLGGTFPAAGLTGVHFIIDNTGTVVTLAGTAQNAPDATIDLAPFGAMRIGTGAAIVGGKVAGGTTGSLVGAGANASLTLRDVTLAAPLSFPTGGTLSFDGAWSIATADGGSVSANAATINLGGSFRRADAVAIQQTAGVINFTGTLDNTGGTLTLDNATGTWNVMGGTVRGGTLKTSGNAKFFVLKGQTATLDGVTLDAELPLNASTLTVANGLTLAGTRQITGTGGTTVSLTGSAAQSVGGTGTVAFDANAGNLLINDSGGAATLESGLTVRGQALTIHGGAKGIVNRGTIVADAGGTVHLFDVDNQGHVRVNNGGALTARGTLAAPANGSLIVDGGSLTAGSIDLSNAGQFTFTGGRVELDRGTLTPKGAAFAVPAGGTLAGTGTVAGNVTSGGTVSPGRAGLAGVLSVSGDYAQSSAGTLHVDLNAGEAGIGFDRLGVSGAASLSGNLDLARAAGFVPTVGQSFIILTGTRSGTFSTVTGATAPGQPSFAVSYQPTGVTVTAALPGDIDLDRFVGPGDFNVLASNFGTAGQTWASGDLDGDGLIGPGDFNLLASSFGRSELVGPVSITAADFQALQTFASSTVVPEPATASAAMLATAVIWRRSRKASALS